MSTMNNTNMNTDLESLLENVYYHMIIWFGFFLFINGNIGNIINMAVYGSKKFRKRACFIYLFWESVTNFLFFNFILTTRILQSGFSIPIMTRFESICKIREFFSEYLYEIGNMFFVFATIDRILSAQRSVRWRQWSNRVSLAYKLVIGGFLIWLPIVGHRLIFYSIYDEVCHGQPGVYIFFDTYLEVFLSGIYSPLVVIIVAILLLRSARHFIIQRRVAPNPTAPADQSHIRQIDTQLATMLLLQSILAIITYVPYGCEVLYSNITSDWNKSSLRLAWEKVIIGIIRLFSYLFPACGFHISMISNHAYRSQVRRLFGFNRKVNIRQSTNHITQNS